MCTSYWYPTPEAYFQEKYDKMRANMTPEEIENENMTHTRRIGGTK